MVKKVLIILILLICAFSISNVSANDNDDASFTDLDYEIYFAEDELDLSSNYVRQDSDPSGPIVIYSDIVINGNDYVIDGSGGNIFTIEQGVSVTINDATFINGYAFGTLTGDLYDGYGGAISNFGTLTLNNCIFLNNTATYRGGAIYNEGYLEIDNSIFDNNDITTRTTNLDYGGAAICNWGGVLEVTNTNITNNLPNYVIRNSSAEYVGDLLNGVVMNTAEASFENCNFINNSGCYGGAITLIGYAGHAASLNINNCTFINNIAYNGGALDLIGGTFDIKDSKFYGNSAIGRGETNDSVGGAVCSFYGDADGNITDCIFINNSALYHGGAITLQDGNDMISNCLFENNVAGENGGAIDITPGSETQEILIENSNFTNNVAGVKGGAICNSLNGQLYIVNTVFENNTAVENGGAIYNNGNLTVTGSIFLDNNAPDSEDINENGESLDLTDVISNRKGIGNDGAEIPNVRYITSTSVYNAVSNFTDNVIIRGRVTPTANGIVTVNIKNKGNIVISKNGPVVNGNYALDMGKIPIFGEYGIEVTFDENDKYFSSSAKGNLTITGAPANLSADNVVKYYKNGTGLKIDLTAMDGTPLSDETIQVTIDDMIYDVVTDENGLASLPLDMLPGNYTADIIFLGSSVYVGCEKTVSIEILDTVISNDVVKYYRNDTQYTVKVLDGQGNFIANELVTVSLSGPSFKDLKYNIVTDEKGVATLPINLIPGQYTISASANGYNVNNTILVLKESYSLKSEDIKMQYGDGTRYNVTLLNDRGMGVSGKVVTLVLNGQYFKNLKYDRVTDENGTAYLPINLASGKYEITAEFGSASVTTTIDVLQVLYNLISNDVVKYYRNGTQYTVTVLDNQGNPVFDKVVTVVLNGSGFRDVKYNIITDENGVATLPINLVSGNYSISACVGGNSVKNIIEVLPVLTSDGLTKAYGQPASLTAKLVDGQGNPACGQILTFTFKNVSYDRVTDENGVASLPIHLIPGSYSFKISYGPLNANVFTDVVVVKD